ncbi:hypothetical protein [Mesorhizobium sp. M0500]|uniref:hypothetical protein n=1 Tax=Mesorhizobium sp. M0500 TaxID=2956953 RepID=UPI00333BA79A
MTGILSRVVMTDARLPSQAKKAKRKIASYRGNPQFRERRFEREKATQAKPPGGSITDIMRLSTIDTSISMYLQSILLPIDSFLNINQRKFRRT